MSRSLFKRVTPTTQCMRFLRARFTALLVVLTLAGSLAGALSATPGGVSANGGSGAGGDPGNGIVLANGGSGGGGDPGNEIVLATGESGGGDPGIQIIVR